MTGALDWLYNTVYSILKYLGSWIWIFGWMREKIVQEGLHARSQSKQNQGKELGIDQKVCNDNSIGSIRQHNKDGIDINLKSNTSRYLTTEIKSERSSRVTRRVTHNPVHQSLDASVSNMHLKTMESRVITDTHNPVHQSLDTSVSNMHLKTMESRVIADTHNSVHQSLDASVSNMHLKTTESRVITDTHNSVHQSLDTSVSNMHLKTMESRVIADTHNSVHQSLDASVSNMHLKTTESRVITDTHNSVHQSLDASVSNSHVKTTESRVIADTHNSVHQSLDTSVSNMHLKTTESRVITDTHNSVHQSLDASVSNSHVKTTESRVIADTHNSVHQSLDTSVSNMHLKTMESRVIADTHNSVHQSLDASVSNMHLKTTESRVITDTHNSVHQSLDTSVSNMHLKTMESRVIADTHNSVHQSLDASVSNMHLKTMESRVITDTHNSVHQSPDSIVSNSHVKTTGSRIKTDILDTLTSVNQCFISRVSSSHVQTTGSRVKRDSHGTHNSVNVNYESNVLNSHAFPLLTESKKEMAAHRVLRKHTEKSFDNKPDKNVTCGRSSYLASNTYRPKPINQRPYPKYVGRKTNFRGGTTSLQRNQWEREYQNKNWKPVIKTFPRKRRSYNERRRSKYESTNVDYRHVDEIQQFYDEKVKVDNASKFETQQHVDSILQNVLKSPGNKGRFAKWADAEGSVAVGVKVGKADESDHSVDIVVDNKYIELSDEPFGFEFEDDVDRYHKEELSTPFVDAGKRCFPDERRKLTKPKQRQKIPDGHIAARIKTSDSLKFNQCCIQRHSNSGDRRWFLPYYVLSAFHSFVGHAVQGHEYITLNKGVKGPAVTLTVFQEGGPNISIDITLKLTLPTNTLCVRDFGWPRRDTRKWLTKNKIDAVIDANLYLVPKGDKYWKISFANCECELLSDIDKNNTWRKGCLRIMKKKFMIWQSKSMTGFKGLSSYLLKTTLLWLCEILPDDEFWYEDELANCCLNFLQELENRLRNGRIGEYFNPSINLLENKDVDCIEELREFVEEEISLLTN